jgi:hypothetical protein
VGLGLRGSVIAAAAGSSHTVGTFCSASQAPNFCTSLPYTGCPSCIWSCPKACVLLFGGSVSVLSLSVQQCRTLRVPGRSYSAYGCNLAHVLTAAQHHCRHDRISTGCSKVLAVANSRTREVTDEALDSVQPDEFPVLNHVSHDLLRFGAARTVKRQCTLASVASVLSVPNELNWWSQQFNYFHTILQHCEVRSATAGCVLNAAFPDQISSVLILQHASELPQKVTLRFLFIFTNAIQVRS